MSAYRESSVYAIQFTVSSIEWQKGWEGQEILDDSLLFLKREEMGLDEGLMDDLL